MSRIGKTPITIPSGVEIKIENNLVEVKGPKGTLYQQVNCGAIQFAQEDGQLTLSIDNVNKRNKSMHGLYRQLIYNMVVGVSQGYTLELELYGVGYRAKNTGQLLELQLGYSHPSSSRQIW